MFLSSFVNLFNFFFATNLTILICSKMKVINKLKFPKKSLKIINPIPHFENFNEPHFISLIHSSKNTLQLQQIHGQIIRKNLSSNSRIVAQLISSASLHKSINYGLSIFNCFLDKNVFLFNVLIRGLKENSLFEKSILYFRKMIKMGVRPDKLTYPFVLKSVTALGEKGVGGGVHCAVLKVGLEYDTFVRVCLVELYVKVELVDFALQLFDESSERNKVESVILWNVVINGCCKIGRMSKALALFEEMPERNVGSWNTLISGLLRNGEVDKAMELFDEMTNEKNVVSWTCMIHGLMLNGLHQKALDLFFKMVEEGVKPNGLTVVSALSACAKTGALEAGKKIHDNIMNNGLHLNAAVGNALLDMYAKCGYIESASLVFSGLKEKDIRTWSIMIWGWAIHGHVDKALRCFEQMRLTGIKPDGVSVLAVLTGCSHAGRVDQGLQIFDSMQRECSIEPTMKHYAAVVDLLGRAGRFDEALKFIASMPLEPDYVIWGALFSACRAHKNIEMAKVVSEKLLQLEPKHAGGYVFLSNVYAGAGRWDDVERVRSSMKNKNVEKDPGWSSMEVDGQLHTFVAGDSAHTRKQEIYLKLEEIITGAKQQGYMPETEWVLHNIDEEEKEGALGSHSEKLALAFGLISTGPGVIIMIVKNLRVCGDCHSLMKHVSRMSQRVIVLRDIKRFHHFKDGVCSCKDYW